MSSLVVSMLLSGAGAAPTTTADHPTLSQLWQATVSEAQVGVVYESENYVPDHAVCPSCNLFDSIDDEWKYFHVS